ncbi:HEAT repeat domain-containing protein [Treponema zuelzerae]|uniref:HEAT repeat domain-containing protein n=1 Tax=Teretinema zuelzerae TaxID=156 RepID=A0AAE3JJZ9_9SPIR|nr:HEAT repeat domain-containing protein [Teretinema zuelzerae]MCD1654760.1 HEAT repeat domain-containing protein [Teretinema zuelzerae]
MKRFLALICAFASSMFLFSLEKTDLDIRRDILAYGLENEIVELIDALIKEDESGLQNELQALFDSTRSSAVKESLLKYYGEKNDPYPKEWALSIIADPWDHKKTTVLSIFSYIEKMKAQEAASSVRAILKSENTDYRDSAISLLGSIGTEEDADFLFDFLEDEFSVDEKTRLVIRQNVMTALGKLKAEKYRVRFEEVAGNEDENAVIRSTAAVALGEIGNPESIPILESLFLDKDPLLRSASVKALSGYSSEASTAIILEGFKDPYYKVRLDAIASAEKLKLNESVPYLLYRSKSDPVESVRYRSYEALGLIGDQEGYSWLAEQFANKKNAEGLRLKAASVLAEHHKTSFSPLLLKELISVLEDEKKIKYRYELLKLMIAKRTELDSSVCISLLTSKDPTTKSFGIDLFELYKFTEAKSEIEKIAADEKQGALHRRAKRIIESDKTTTASGE